MNVCLPGAVLCTAVDVGPVIQQVLHDVEPATGARFMESTVPGVVSVIHLTHSVLQTVQHHLLKRANTEAEYGSVCEIMSCVCACVRVRVCVCACAQQKQNKTKRTSQKNQTHTQSVLSFTVPLGGKLGKRGTDCFPVPDKRTHTNAP